MSRRFSFAVVACLTLILGLTVTAPAEAAKPKYKLNTVKVGDKTYVRRWNPCQTITYKVYLGAVPRKHRASVLKDTHAAVRAVAKATGIPWSYRGTTGEVPQTSTIGAQSAEVIIAWTKPGRTNLGLKRGNLGVAVPQMEQGYDENGVYIPPVLTRGAIAMRTPELVPDLPAGPGKGLRRRNVVMHELGHMAGLAHVFFKTELMFPGDSGQMPKGFHTGDKAGLAKLGVKGGCMAVPAGSDLT